MKPVKKCGRSEILPNLHSNKLSRYCTVDAGTRYKTPRSETKDFIFCSQQHQHICISFPDWHITQHWCVGLRWHLHVQWVALQERNPGSRAQHLSREQTSHFPSTVTYLITSVTRETALYQETDQPNMLMFSAGACWDSEGPWRTASPNRACIHFIIRSFHSKLP